MEKSTSYREKITNEVANEASDLAAELLGKFEGQDKQVVLNAIVRLAATPVIGGMMTRAELIAAIDDYTEMFAN